MQALIFLATLIITLRTQADAHVRKSSEPSGGLPSVPTLSRRQGFAEPCAEVSASWAAQATGIITRENRAHVPAQVAFDCLQSVPLDVGGDIKEIEELKNFVQFQSTLSYLKAGHSTHNQPFDILDNLNRIAERVKNRTYGSDFEAQFAIHALFRSAGDFHLHFRPDLLDIFLFARSDGQLVSVSDDGISLPKLYFFSDIESMRNDRFLPSPLMAINGVSAPEYLAGLGTHGVYHDADARYNSFFANPAAATMGMDSGGQFLLTQGLFDGSETHFEFLNGSFKTVANIAIVREFYNFTNVYDGLSLFSKFCQGPPVMTKSKLSKTMRNAIVPPTMVMNPKVLSTPIGYPLPHIMQSGLSIQGYYLNDTDYDKVAVLALPNFQPISEPTEGLSGIITGFLEAQDVLRQFFAGCLQDGKRKLVIDLRGNSGGTIDMAFELFKQLFPSIEPFGAARYRAHEAFELYSAAVADLSANFTFATSSPELFAEVVGSTANYRNVLNVGGAAFETFRDYYGPYLINNDTFTAARRYNANVTGYSSEGPMARQPFEAEDMVILQDGFCGSACAIFSELMREQGHVHTIAVGGRPLNKPMQGVGGTKGAQMFTFDSIVHHMKTTLKIAETLYGPTVAESLNRTAVGKILRTEQLYLRSAHHNPAERINGAVNALDNLRQHDPSETPLEFLYEAADCRLFYTMDSVRNPIPLWKMAVDAKWGNGTCVEGSTGDPSAISTIRNEPFNTRQISEAVSKLTISGLIWVVAICILVAFSGES